MPVQTVSSADSTVVSIVAFLVYHVICTFLKQSIIARTPEVVMSYTKILILAASIVLAATPSVAFAFKFTSSNPQPDSTVQSTKYLSQDSDTDRSDDETEPPLTPYVTPQGGYKRVKFWLKAFIPREYDNKFTVIGGAGTHSRKTGIDAPDGDFIGLGYGCFLTDQRSFSPWFSASARLTSFIELDLISGRMLDSGHYSDPTIRADCENGKEISRSTGNQSRNSFSPLETKREFGKDGTTTTYKTSLTGSVGDPETPAVGTPRVDHVGNFNVLHLAGHNSGDSAEMLLVTYDGKVDDFPYFEAYCQVDDYPAQKIFQKSVPPGKSLVQLLKSLYGGASNPVSGTCSYGYAKIVPQSSGQN